MSIKNKAFATACVTALCVGGAASVATAQEAPPANGDQMDWMTTQPSGPADLTVAVDGNTGTVNLDLAMNIGIDKDNLGVYNDNFADDFDVQGNWTTLFMTDGTQAGGEITSVQKTGTDAPGKQVSYSASFKDVAFPDGGNEDGSYTDAELKAMCVGLGMLLPNNDGEDVYERKQFCWKFDESLQGSVAGGAGTLTLSSDSLIPTGLNGEPLDPDPWAPTDPTDPTDPSDTDTPDPTDPTDPSDTDKPEPSDTDKPKPSNTDKPKPSNTDKPEPSDTDKPKPSNTDKPKPSNSPKPTGSPLPTDSPRKPVTSVPSGSVF